MLLWQCTDVQILVHEVCEHRLGRLTRRCSVFCLSNGGPLNIVPVGSLDNASTSLAGTSSDALSSPVMTPEQLAHKVSPRDSPINKQRSTSRSGTKPSVLPNSFGEKNRSYTTGTTPALLSFSFHLSKVFLLLLSSPSLILR